MLKKVAKYFIPIILLVSILFGGITTLGIADTLHGVRQALMESTGTAIYKSNYITVFVFPKNGSYAFTGLSNAGGVYHLVRTICNANCADIKTITDLIKWMEENGFSRVYPKELPVELVSFIMSFRIYLVSIGFGTFPTFWAFPIAILDNPTHLINLPEVIQ